MFIKIKSLGACMSISSVGSGMTMPPPPPPKGEQASLTEDQESLISEILSEYDSESLSESDALSIVESLSDAGIEPGKALEEAMSDLGFDAKTVGDLAGVERSQPPGGAEFNTEGSIVVDDMMDFLSELLSDKLENAEDSVDSLSSAGDLFKRAASELSDDDKESIYAQLREKFGLPDAGSLIDLKA